jgi:hypothetical protein
VLALNYESCVSWRLGGVAGGMGAEDNSQAHHLEGEGRRGRLKIFGSMHGLAHQQA